MTCDVNDLLLDGKCFACLSEGEQEALILQLLCDISDLGLS